MHGAEVLRPMGGILYRGNRAGGMDVYLDETVTVLGKTVYPGWYPFSAGLIQAAMDVKIERAAGAEEIADNLLRGAA